MRQFDTIKKRNLFFLFIILIISRAPELFLYPRFWAEEGTEFFHFAFHNSFLKNLTFPQVGYYTLFNSITSEIAVLVPLEYAPLITTIFSFLIQIIPISIILFTNYIFWKTLFQKILISIVIIFLTPWEIWITTTNSHIFFGLIILLISLSSSEEDSNVRKIFYRFLIILGTLTGPASSFNAPIFLLRAYLERKKEILIQAVIITICSLIQFSSVVYSILYNNKYSRLSSFDISFFIDNYIRDSFALLLPFENNTLIIIGFLIFSYLAFTLDYSKLEIKFLLITFIITTFLSLLGSLHMKGSPRYSYIPTIIIYIILIYQYQENKNKKNLIKKFSFYILLFSLSFSISNFTKDKNQFYSSNFPKWKEEVKKYKSDNNYKLKIHPYAENVWVWEFNLKK